MNGRRPKAKAGGRGQPKTGPMAGGLIPPRTAECGARSGYVRYGYGVYPGRVHRAGYTPGMYPARVHDLLGYASSVMYPDRTRLASGSARPILLIIY